jgi:DNA-binding GntR family transcriptional regulator
MVTDAEARGVLESGQIDRSSPIPLYHQLEYLLRREIENGSYRPGDTLPSEGEICARYEVSRSVVRQTLTNLTHAGIIRTERGRGSFVAERKLQERFVQRTTGLYDDLRRLLHDEFPKLRVAASGSASFDLRQKTGEPLAGRQKVYRLYPVSLAERNPRAPTLPGLPEQGMIFGGYPEIVTTDSPGAKRELLRQIAAESEDDNWF